MKCEKAQRDHYVSVLTAHDFVLGLRLQPSQLVSSASIGLPMVCRINRADGYGLYKTCQN